MISAYDQALKYLSMKMHSCSDLSDKLLKKGYPAEDVEKVIEQLQTENFLNDTRYAETFIRNLLTYRTFGYYGIKRKLLLKKLDKALVDKLVSEFVDEKTEKEVAKRYMEKNKGKNRESMIAAMQRKGFRTGVILKVIND